MLPNTTSKELAILVPVDFSVDSWHEELDEFRDLVTSAGPHIVDVCMTRRRSPDKKYFVGLGKAQELAAEVARHQIDIVIFNHALSPSQERNLERLLECRVIGRIRLILDIFAQRARTFEGKLQVELAQLNHMATRLVRGWTHLERQKGGVGLRGPGETQLESDRRLLRARVKTIKARLEKVRSQREQGRHSRTRAEIPSVSLVGYTNAGKSTLFNRLTGAEVYAANKLFATLDPTLRQIDVQNFGSAILVDTVGFIRHLPHELVDAFQATLDETKAATLLLHVQDISHPACQEHAEQVQAVLTSIEADDVPQIQIYNKIDGIQDAHYERNPGGQIDKIWLSAKTGIGIDYLWQALAERLAGNMIQTTIILTSAQGKLRALLYQHQYVMSETITPDGEWQVSLKMPAADHLRWFPDEYPDSDRD